jgi:hypothetical protein
MFCSRVVFFCNTKTLLDELESSPWDISHEYVISTSGDATIQINPICPSSMTPKMSPILLQTHYHATTLVRYVTFLFQQNIG